MIVCRETEGTVCTILPPNGQISLTLSTFFIVGLFEVNTSQYKMRC